MRSPRSACPGVHQPRAAGLPRRSLHEQNETPRYLTVTYIAHTALQILRKVIDMIQTYSYYKKLQIFNKFTSLLCMQLRQT